MQLAEPLTALGQGRVVAAATETYFGLLADATRPDAIDRLLALKPRGCEKGIPVLLPAYGAWHALVAAVPPLAERLAKSFWPGPLTIALTAASHIDRRLILDGRLAVRLAGPSPAAQLAQALGRPLTATSANLPGSAPATTADEIRSAFGRSVGTELLVLDGSAPGAAASTVVVVNSAGYRVVRSGRITRQELVVAAGLDPQQSKR